MLTEHIYSGAEIETRVNPLCCVCGGLGQEIYRFLSDRNFGAPGRWHLRRCDNRDCGLLWLDPVPTERDIHKAYELDYLTHHETEPGIERQIKRGYLAWKLCYDPDGVSSIFKVLARVASVYAPTRRVMEFPVRYLAETRAGRLLDVGCGAGDVLMLARSLGWQAEGIDFDPIAVQFARKRGLRVRFGTFEDHDFREDSFDAIILSHVVEHVHDPRTLLRKIRTLLVPGGRLYLATPNGSGWGHHLLAEQWPLLDPPRHLNIFSVPSMLRLCREAGFTSLGIRTSIRGAYGAFLSSRLRRGAANRLVSTAARIWASKMTFLESMRLRRDFRAGEEINLTAVR